MTRLSEVALVIRGGQGRDATQVLGGLRLLAANNEPMKLSVFGTSPEGDEGRTDTLVRLCREAKARWGSIQVSSVDTLAAAGFELLDERSVLEAPCHYHVEFSHDVTQSDIQRFLDCFDGPEPNPVPKKERG